MFSLLSPADLADFRFYSSLFFTLLGFAAEHFADGIASDASARYNAEQKESVAKEIAKISVISGKLLRKLY